MDLSVQMFRDIPGVIRHHYDEGNFHWRMIAYMSFGHVVAVAGVMALPRAKYETLLWSFVLWQLCGFGIAMGIHRLWSHRSYEAALPVRIFLMLCFSAANQGSIYHWARDHRVHHQLSETNGDPHNASRGFFFAHIGWLFVKKHPDVVKAGRAMDFTDLEQDFAVYLQKMLHPWLDLYMCFVMPAQVAAYFWSEDFWTAFYVAGGLRHVIVLHATFLVNSVGHLYGDHPYDQLSYPAENPLVAIFAMGDGWHNWHHKYPCDYAGSEFGISTQYNPSKLFIDILAALGLVWGRKRATGVWKLGRARRDRDAANGVQQPKAPPRPWEVKVASKKDACENLTFPRDLVSEALLFPSFLKHAHKR